ncbi:MAG: SusD/RagB family nutrient-binding outer membrane lipoprotein, partial [Chitinophagia bacterium]|nr:SusD/RagB family nutrient-binding outer membrane lipoprotein [Chitinophagia bacterium]
FKNKPYKAISLYMRAYAFQLITDAWGDAPFRQALRGQQADSGYINPKYDSQRVIYMSLLKYIDSAEYLINTSSTSIVGKEDLIYQGDMSKWLAFGHTLKLKMLVRLTKRDPAFAAAELSKLFASNPTFIDDNTQNAQINFSATTSNRNPLYAEMAALNYTQNIVGSKTVIDSMNVNNDDRVYVFYNSLSNGTVAGITQGDYNTSVPTSTYSTPSPAVGVGTQAMSDAGAAPVKFLTAQESYFLRAEVAANGWAATPNTDEEYFYFGIDTSFNDWGLTSVAYKTSGGYWTVYPTAGTAEEKTEFIITQKWFAMCGNQGFEAWSELRRTGYPKFFVPSITSQTGPNPPARFLYPTSESTRNVNYPGLAPITQRVWWDF